MSSGRMVVGARCAGTPPLFCFLLLLSVSPAIVASIVVRPAALNLTSAPYVDFTAPTHGQCFPSGTDIEVQWKVVFSVGREEGETFLAHHGDAAEVCCVPLEREAATFECFRLPHNSLGAPFAGGAAHRGACEDGRSADHV